MLTQASLADKKHVNILCTRDWTLCYAIYSHIMGIIATQPNAPSPPSSTAWEPLPLPERYGQRNNKQSPLTSTEHITSAAAHNLMRTPPALPGDHFHRTKKTFLPLQITSIILKRHLLRAITHLHGIQMSNSTENSFKSTENIQT
jgi:hypothetical protein